MTGAAVTTRAGGTRRDRPARHALADLDPDGVAILATVAAGTVAGRLPQGPPAMVIASVALVLAGMLLARRRRSRGNREEAPVRSGPWRWLGAEQRRG